MQHFDPEQKDPENRRDVNPPIEVESAMWSAGGTLDWWVKERQQWLGRVRGPDGHQKWIKATDLRPAKTDRMIYSAVRLIDGRATVSRSDRGTAVQQDNELVVPDALTHGPWDDRVVVVEPRGFDGRLVLNLVATLSTSWADTSNPLVAYTGSSDASATAQVGNTLVPPEQAAGLKFAIEQVLYNVRRHGQKDYTLLGWEKMLQIAVRVLPVGGQRNLYIAIQSASDPESVSDVAPQCVFREPISRGARLSFGAYLAGEILRRCGGAAIFRVDDVRIRSAVLTTSELCVPLTDYRTS